MSIDSNFNVNDEKWFTESGLKVASLNVNRLIGKLDQIKMCLGVTGLILFICLSVPNIIMFIT